MRIPDPSAIHADLKGLLESAVHESIILHINPNLTTACMNLQRSVHSIKHILRLPKVTKTMLWLYLFSAKSIIHRIPLKVSRPASLPMPSLA
jgi:hypothetical protein